MRTGHLQLVSTNDHISVMLEGNSNGGSQQEGAIGSEVVTTDATGSEGRGFELSTQNVVLSVFLFILAGILEIGGGYLYW